MGFIDSDDWVTPDYYERLLARARETGADVVGCDYSLVSERGFDMPLRDYFPVFHPVDHIAFPDGLQPVGDDDQSLPALAGACTRTAWT